MNYGHPLFHRNLGNRSPKKPFAAGISPLDVAAMAALGDNVAKKTTKKTAGVEVIRPLGEMQEALEGDGSYELRERILKDIEALAAAAEEGTLDGKASRACIQWYTLAAYLGDAGILCSLNAAAEDMAADRGHFNTEIDSAVSMGEAMHLFFDGASEQDFTLKNNLVEAIMGATENLDEKFTGRHWGMAVTDLARIAYFAEISEDAG